MQLFMEALAKRFSELILGAQDGIVNVLGIVLGVAIGTGNSSIVLLAGLAATFAESISMGAVAYTSMEAKKKYFLLKEKQEMDEFNFNKYEAESEIKEIYKKKGFSGKLLNDIVKHIMKSKKSAVESMLREEIKMSPEEYKQSPLNSGLFVFISALMGSLIPVIPFAFLEINSATFVSFTFSSIALFLIGYIKAKITIGNAIKSGLELLIIGIGAAIAGFAIGSLFGVAI